jgi:hypothetical protein
MVGILSKLSLTSPPLAEGVELFATEFARKLERPSVVDLG